MGHGILLRAGDVPGAWLLAGRGRAARALRAPLIPLAKIYEAAIRIDRRLPHRRARVPVPVISVGNITAGGTGKTPFVEWVARCALARGRRPGILSRGYGGGDEVRLLAERLPEVPQRAGRDRARVARAWLEEPGRPDLLILDDGFQHRGLARDLDLVLVDAIIPFGFGRLLPAGLLREPVDGLGRAHGIAITRADLCHPDKVATIESFLRARFPGIPVARVVDRPLAWTSLAGETRPPGAFRGATAVAVCGIGNPAGFFRRIERLGVRLAARVPFPDHHRYTRGEIEEIDRRARALGASALLLTRKDAIKIDPARTARDRWWVLRSEIAFLRGEESFVGLLEGCL